jgi:hypothetical protein
VNKKVSSKRDKKNFSVCFYSIKEKKMEIIRRRGSDENNFSLGF